MTTHSWAMPDDHTAPAEARRLVSDLLEGTPCADDAIQIVSELVANAVDHGESPITVTITLTPQTAHIAVESTARGEVPERHDATLDEFRGRGLAIIDLLASEWGWRQTGSRLEVWADVPLTEQSSPISDH